MATEIELKAWVDDPAATAALLDGAWSPLAVYDKDDEYWRPGDPARRGSLGSGVRIRTERTASRSDASPDLGQGLGAAVERLLGGRDGVTAVVNFKKKEVRAGIEVNDEREFSVDEPDTFRELLRRLDLRPAIRKRKRGLSWSSGDATLELSEVAGLGVFLEIEILADSDDQGTVAAARKRLRELLAGAGIDEGRIEERYYTELLEARGLGRP